MRHEVPIHLIALSTLNDWLRLDLGVPDEYSVKRLRGGRIEVSFSFPRTRRGEFNQVTLQATLQNFAYFSLQRLEPVAMRFRGRVGTRQGSEFVDIVSACGAAVTSPGDVRSFELSDKQLSNLHYQRVTQTPQQVVH